MPLPSTERSESVKNCIITISREYGAGGHSIGKRVAEELGRQLLAAELLAFSVLIARHYEA